MTEHESVLKQEAVEALVMKTDGAFIDCTYGRGGHSEMILDRLTEQGRMMVIDKDQAAIEHAIDKYGDDSRVVVVRGSFRNIADFVAEYDFQPLDGVLVDLGVSSTQLDQSERGFSFNQDGPLDMRMDQSRGQTVAEWLAVAEERDIIFILRKYGEERFARRIARNIVDVRRLQSITTTQQLVDIIETAIPRRDPNKHPATRSFQAFRIYINDELGELETLLEATVPLLVTGGRLVVISFHSLEDRIVKRFMRNMAKGETLPDRLPIPDAQIKRHLKLVGKPVKPSAKEIERNRRARSSIMRVSEKLR
ncbi:MAG TPA: 16S rRNA (cytosine(1402)-N(4))-methyltransferase RsmH [Pseudomonadales bacterium]|jgi:16S rRNA (cytosine1402-N4)-methyltransferase|nr:16S rRNA (cytosine(1402)-N(4))-methyltransferase RsmH [Pseudomonadales bacterium]MDP6316041.1 16S rRNA (cytosine(1402)-N(4))-methyltransferase RsmH [Pseudomonadales bacterium]MDP7313963.1 16S rRNA (cytosine(1402)-N(4))-methyltransferase RsmH [Pseudomonadales bacterium]HJP52109.1 16S rRNA (cytosine(1402)-N(4))-methyltransferase RsmH [Pseudomonadales bacterium]|tara:strand:- start:5531 stop:6454 length:924 start_codon:yes stop_codon:yes gene_type:complete